MGLTFKKKRCFIFFAVSSKSELYQNCCAAELLEQAKARLKASMAEKTYNLFIKNIDAAELVCPQDWQCFDDFTQPSNVLGADSWNAICMYICKKHGDFRYKKKNTKTFHILTDDKELAIFKITAFV